jgi:hypothetical protein
MWPFPLSAPAGSPLRKGMTVRVVETGGCDGGVRRRVWEGKVTGFIYAYDKWPNSNFEKGSPYSIFVEIQTDSKKAFIDMLNGTETKVVMHYPAMRNYWHQYIDGVWEYEI